MERKLEVSINRVGRRIQENRLKRMIWKQNHVPARGKSLLVTRLNGDTGNSIYRLLSLTGDLK